MAGVRRFEDLVAWRLSEELREAVFLATGQGLAARDPDFRSQIRRSSASAPDNIAEGFGRFRPKDYERAITLAKQALAASAGLQRYLLSCTTRTQRP